MKPFNLKEAKAGKPVCTRDGKPARIICFDVKTITNKYPILALITEDNHEIILPYSISGIFSKGYTKDSYDLMMAPEKREGWINLYRSDRGDIKAGSVLYFSKEDAREIAKYSTRYVTTAKIEWEE